MQDGGHANPERDCRRGLAASLTVSYLGPAVLEESQTSRSNPTVGLDGQGLGWLADGSAKIENRMEPVVTFNQSEAPHGRISG